jgi:hypothetical protein
MRAVQHNRQRHATTQPGQTQIDSRAHSTTISAMGFNRRKMEDQRRQIAALLNRRRRQRH